MRSAVWGRQAASAESVWYSPGTLIAGQFAGEGVLSRAEFSVAKVRGTGMGVRTEGICAEGLQ